MAVLAMLRTGRLCCSKLSLLPSTRENHRSFPSALVPANMSQQREVPSLTFQSIGHLSTHDLVRGCSSRGIGGALGEVRALGHTPWPFRVRMYSHLAFNSMRLNGSCEVRNIHVMSLRSANLGRRRPLSYRRCRRRSLHQAPPTRMNLFVPSVHRESGSRCVMENSM
jgi:hypothetical protein